MLIIMGKVTGIKGMRHIALKVTDVKRSKAFYQENFGMDVVWEPDPQNVYLSSGIDNLALHAAPNVSEAAPKNSQLDHLGFLVDSIERAQELEKEFRSKGISIVHPFKLHRDGSASFYCADPDGIVIQMLYEPTLSRQEIG
ncbi:MAG: VOC family protein [Candidatus Binatia bacterium]